MKLGENANVKYSWEEVDNLHAGEQALALFADSKCTYGVCLFFIPSFFRGSFITLLLWCYRHQLHKLDAQCTNLWVRDSLVTVVVGLSSVLKPTVKNLVQSLFVR